MTKPTIETAALEAAKEGIRCGVCKRTELEDEKFALCSFCGRPFCYSHMAYHELGCPSRPREKPAKEYQTVRLSARRKVAAILLTALVVGSVFTFVLYPGATDKLQGAIGDAASYLSNYVGRQVQGSGSASQTAVTTTNSNQSSATTAFVLSESTTEQTSSQTAQPLSIDSQWVASFIAAVNSHRSSNLTENSALDQFASNRFDTLSANYEITHYGFAQDVNSFFSGQTIQVAEEYFFPNLGPAAYAQLIQTSFVAHWEGLVDPTYTHFGYYVGRGPVDVRLGSCSAPLETLGTINETQQLIQYGCHFSVVTMTYVVIELSD